MKKVLLLLALAIFGQFAIAQDMKRQDANNYQRQAQQLIDAADDYKAVNKMDKAAKQMNNAKILMQKAKASIDAASVHEATMNQAKTWHYYAVIYYKIGAYQEFKDLDPDAFTKVLGAIEKIKELDQSYFRQMGQELASYVSNIDINYYQNGVESYNNGNLEEAMGYFQKANEAANTIGAVDDAALIALGQCALKLGQYDVVVSNYETLLNKNFDDVAIYLGLITAYRELGNGEKAVETVAAARAKYPDNPNVINEMINTYRALNRENEIIGDIEAMAQKYPDQPGYYYILGNIYGKMESDIFDLEKALEYYGKALEINPQYGDVYYDAGVVLMNKAAEISQEAEEKDPKDFSNFNEYLNATDKLAADARVYNERALPYMVKAYELLPEDAVVKQALRTLYARLKMMDKAKELE